MERYVSNAFQEAFLSGNRWVGKIYENKTGAFELGNLMGNRCKVISGEI